MNMLNDYFGHGLGSIAAQYYQQSGSTYSFVQNRGELSTSY